LDKSENIFKCQVIDVPDNLRDLLKNMIFSENKFRILKKRMIEFYPKLIVKLEIIQTIKFS